MNFGRGIMNKINKYVDVSEYLKDYIDEMDRKYNYFEGYVLDNVEAHDRGELCDVAEYEYKLGILFMRMWKIITNDIPIFERNLLLVNEIFGAEKTVEIFGYANGQTTKARCSQVRNKIRKVYREKYGEEYGE